MPRSASSDNKWRALFAAISIVLILCTGFHSSAQQRKRRGKPATQTPAQTDSNSNSATATPTPKPPQKKNLAALRGSDSPEGGRATITSDAPLNDYEAYRSGNRYYVVIPQANAPSATGGVRGRGYDDVQVHKRGNDTVLSFRLKPGTTAHVNQKFNRLEVVFNTPGDSSSGVAATGSQPGTAGAQTANGNANAPHTGTPSGAANTSGATTATGANLNANTGASGATTSSSPSTGAGVVPPTPTGSPSTALLPSVTPGLGPTVESSPATVAVSPTPPADQVAQSQPAPSIPTAVTTTPAASGTSLGTVLKNNWLLVLIAALLLITVGLVAMTRSRSARDATMIRPIGDKETPTALEEGTTAKAEAGRLDEAAMAGAVAAVVQPSDRPAAIEPATMLDETETLEAEPVEIVDTERVRLEIKHILTGQEYDASVINAPAKETRQLIESELLFALSKRNTERRERALKAFTQHGYFDDATRDLRTADVPAERAAAARKLGLTRDTVATPHLVAALEDSAPEVRRAAIEALTELGDPAAVGPLESLLEREENRKVPHALVQRAIKASAAGTAVQKETPATAVAEPAPVEEALTVEAPPALAEDVAPPIAETEASSPIAEAANLDAEAVMPGVVAASLVSATVSPTTLPDEEIQDQRTEAEPAIEAEPSSLPDVDIAPAVEAATEASTQSPAAIESAVVEGAVTAAASAAERHRAKADAERIHAEQERLRVEEEARRREEEERQRVKAEAQRQRDEAEAERRRVEEERQRVEEERARAEEETRRHAEEEKKRIEEEARLKAAEEERLRAEEARRQRAEERERRRAEEERARLEVQERERAEADAARRRAEEAALRLAEMRRRAEEEARQREEAETARLLKEEEARRAQEETAERERIEREEAEARQREQEELERQRVAEARRLEEEERHQLLEQKRLRAEEERARVEAEAQRQREAAEAEHARVEKEARLKAAEEERLRTEEETRRHAEEERRRVAEEERQRAEAEAARIQFEQEASERRRREEAEAATYAKTDEIEPVSMEDAVAPAMQPELFESTLAAEPSSFGSSHETSAEIVERKASDWVAVDFNEPEVLPVEQTPAVSAAALDDAAITEYEGAQAEASPIREIEESQAVNDVKEIEIAPAGRGGAYGDDDFASVPGGILRRLSSEVASERAAAVTDLVRIGGDDAFREISAAFDDPAQLVRDAAARSLYDMQSDHAASFTRALREAPSDRRRRIGNALASSGLANEAIGHLMGESREKTYDAFSLLFLMSKAGEVQPLMRAIEEHPNSEVRLAVVKLLALSGQQDILPAFRRLAVRGSLPTEVRSAVMEAIYQISSQSSSDTTHVA